MHIGNSFSLIKNETSNNSIDNHNFSRWFLIFLKLVINSGCYLMYEIIYVIMDVYAINEINKIWYSRNVVIGKRKGLGA